MKNLNKNIIIEVNIRNINGKFCTTSRDVADKLQKRHSDVLSKIKEVLNEREISPVEYLDLKGEKRTEYLLDKDAFTLLLFNYTGYNDFKRAYIKKFNELQNKQEQTLTIPQLNLEFVSEFINLSNRVINILDDKQTTISFQDLITLSKKGMSAEAHNMLTVKSVSDTGNIYGVVKDLKGFASFSQNYINTFSKVNNKLSITE